MFCRQTNADYQRAFLTGILKTANWRFTTAVDWKKTCKVVAQQSV